MDLLSQAAVRPPLAPAMRDPRGLFGHRFAATLRRPTRAPDQQLGHRTQIELVRLQAGEELLLACLFHRGRVELDHLEPGHPEPGDEGLVIVPGRFDADPTDVRVALGASEGHRGGELDIAAFGERESERRDDDLAVMIRDQRHRLDLADIDRAPPDTRADRHPEPEP